MDHFLLSFPLVSMSAQTNLNLQRIIKWTAFTNMTVPWGNLVNVAMPQEMLNKLVSKQHLQGLSCLLQAHLLNDSTKTWSGALVVIGPWAFGLYGNFDTVEEQHYWGVARFEPQLCSRSGAQHSLGKGDRGESGCVHWGAEEQGKLLKSNIISAWAHIDECFSIQGLFPLCKRCPTYHIYKCV